jgi:hypothetical protein
MGIIKDSEILSIDEFTERYFTFKGIKNLTIEFFKPKFIIFQKGIYEADNNDIQIFIKNGGQNRSLRYYILYKKWYQINYHSMKFSCYVFKNAKEFVNVKLREELC